MKVELYHASKYGNGARVAEEFKKLMAAQGNDVNIHHVQDVSHKDLSQADLYIFGSPTHMGRPTREMVRFVKKLSLPSGTRYAVFGTFSAARPDKKTGRMPSDEELDRSRRTIPTIDEQLKPKGLVKVAEMKVFVNPETMKGPLEEGWQSIVAEFVDQILRSP